MAGGGKVSEASMASEAKKLSENAPKSLSGKGKNMVLG
jgi:hypothetical protein